ncbi:response regulator transcription factor [Parapedobacter luteus]|nr:response regulator [Parapedobacter luteus]
MSTKKTVVVLEDDVAIGELLEYLLTEENIEVKLFDRAVPFEREMEQLHADLYLLDIMLPDGDGYEICCKLRKREKTSHTPILLISAHFENIQNGCNAEGFIKKPFHIDELMNHVKRQLQ